MDVKTIASLFMAVSISGIFLIFALGRVFHPYENESPIPNNMRVIKIVAFAILGGIGIWLTKKIN